MSEHGTQRLFAALDDVPMQPDPQFIARLRRTVRHVAAGEPGSSIDTVVGRSPQPSPSSASGLVVPDEATDLWESVDASVDSAVPSAGAEADRRLGDDLTVDYLQQRRAESDGPPNQRRWRGAVIAVAATILAVVGVVVVADGDSGDVVTDPAGSPVDADPVSTPTVADPVATPSVVDALGYRWSRVAHDEAVFGGEGWQAMNDVTAGGPGFVAVGEAIVFWDGEDRREGDAAVWTSVDGLSWSRAPHDEAVFGGDGDNWMHTVIAGGPGLVAIGRIDSSNGEDGPTVIWTSVDGITWTRHEDAFNDGAGPQVGTVPGPGLVIVGHDEDHAAVWTSADGITWSRVPHDEEVFGDRSGDGIEMGAVIAGGPGFVAVGSEGTGPNDNPTGRGQAVVWTSVDGLSWSRVPHDEAAFGGPGEQEMYDVTVGGPGLVAVGHDAQGAPVWTSTDGITWSQIPDPGDVFGGPSQTGTFSGVVLDVVAGSLGLMAFGEDPHGVAAMWTSVDGITWKRDEAFASHQIEPPGAAIAVLPTGLVAVGSDGSDAVVWVATSEMSGSTNEIGDQP